MVVRTPPEVALYHRFGNDLSRRPRNGCATRRGGAEGVQSVVLARTPAPSARRLSEIPGFIVPDARSTPSR